MPPVDDHECREFLPLSWADYVQSFKLVLPENLNHFGFLFGGYMLKWVDEIAWIAATRDFPGHTFVTIGMDQVEFKKGVRKGTILCFNTERVRVGNTSVNYQVDVTREIDNRSQSIFTTTVTMVRVDEQGNKMPVEPPKFDTDSGSD